MSKIERKVPETLEFVKGLLISADAISNSLSEELEPRKVLAQKPTKIGPPRTGTDSGIGEVPGPGCLGSAGG